MPALLYQDGECPLSAGKRRFRCCHRPAGPYGSGGQGKKVPVMTDVACFCGCCFSFDGGAGACPRCGEVASVRGGPAPEDAGRSQPEVPVPVVNGIGQNGQTPEACPERDEAGTLSGRPAGAVHGRGELAGRRPLPAHSGTDQGAR